MHAEVRHWCEQHLVDLGPVDHLVDLGGRDVNGTVRDLVDAQVVSVVDVTDGPDVTDLDDARTWRSFVGPADVVLCTEVLEHVQGWPAIVWTLYEALRPGGVAVVTAAAPERAPHSAVDGGPLRDGEWYQAVGLGDLGAVLTACGFHIEAIEHDPSAGDVRAVARRPGG